MGGCGGNKPSMGKTSNGYTPKKSAARINRGGYNPKPMPTTMSSFGKPSISGVKFGKK